MHSIAVFLYSINLTLEVIILSFFKNASNILWKYAENELANSKDKDILAE